MKEAQHLNGKANFDIRKRPINTKLFQNQKNFKQEFILNTHKKTMGKKYMQQPNIFKQKHDQQKKQHRQIVMSEQFIRSSKLYRLLRQKMDRCDSIFIKEVNSLSDHKTKLKEQIMQTRSENYQEKVSLWELKNKLMELKIMYHEEEEQSKRLAQQNIGEYEGEQEYQGQNDGQNQQNQQDNNEENENFEEPNENDMENIEQESSQNLINSNRKINPQKGSQLQQEKQPIQQSKSQFTQILEQLMSVKAQKQKIEKSLAEEQMSEQKMAQQEQKPNRQLIGHNSQRQQRTTFVNHTIRPSSNYRQ